MHFEELSNQLAQIESILNSRPLTPLSNDPNDAQVLTPGHILIGPPLDVMPEKAQEIKDIRLLKRWELVQTLAQRFWSRWMKGYLSTRQIHTQWQQQTDNFKASDLVCVKKDDASYLK